MRLPATNPRLAVRYRTMLTDLSSAVVNSKTRVLYGTTLTRPTLLVSDGINVVWAADVNVGATDSSGRRNQYYEQKKDGTLNTNQGFWRLGIGDDVGLTPSSDLIGLPGSTDWDLDNSLPGHVDTTLHNVPIARGNADLMYAEVGNAVKCERSADGQWTITGFSIEKPGTHTLVAVDLGDMTIGGILDLSIDTRLLTLAELGELRPFGTLKLGASAIYIGGVLDRIV